MRSFWIVLITAFVASVIASHTWAGEFDGAWEANVEVEYQRSQVTVHKGIVIIKNNSFDSRILDKNGNYNFIKGDISSSDKIHNGYFMWGDKSGSIPIKQGTFTRNSATLTNITQNQSLTIKLSRISNTHTPSIPVSEAGGDSPTMERPSMIIGDTWIEMSPDWLSAGYVKHITKVVSVNENGSFETETRVPELNRLYLYKFDEKHRWLGGEEINSQTIIPEENPSEGPMNYPLWVGKKWEYLNVKGKNLDSGIYYIYNNYYEVVAYEKILLNSEKYQTFKVHWVSENLGPEGGGTSVSIGEGDFWISPEAKSFVKFETSWGDNGELLEFKPGEVVTTVADNSNNKSAANDDSPATDVEPLAVDVRNTNAVAVIIGNRAYEGSIPTVDFAFNDADAIKKFIIERLGYDPDNIIDLRDATQAKLQSTFGNERTHQGKLWSYLDPKGGSDVMIFYSGHGVPGQNDGRGYLLPTNADPNHPEINGYSLDLLYANLGKLEARSITVLLDACFSGGSHAGTLVRAASSILVTPKEIHKSSGEVVVLTAASGDQLASWDEKAKQGLFTRYFLEAVYGAADIDGDGAVDLEEVKAYLDKTMTRRARRDFLREQDAWVSGAPDTVLVQLEAKE